MICQKYLTLYFAWINAEAGQRADALLKLQKHHFYCPECQARQQELTTQAQTAIHPEIKDERTPAAPHH